MTKDVGYIHSTLCEMLKAHVPQLRIRVDKPENLELCGTKEVMQGRKMVDGYYFSSVVPKPKDVRLYFFPIYTHPTAYEDLPEKLRKCLKGKSCFHIKYLDEDLETAIKAMIDKGVALYQADDLI